MIVEVPLWFVIVFISLFGLLIINNIIGDLLGKVMYNYFKDKEKENE